MSTPPPPITPLHEGPRRIEFNNFDYIRLVAAILVIFSHSFLIADGHENNEPLVRLLGPGNIFGIYGVLTFFIVSGFLITRSADLNDAKGFVLSRVLRIYPALLACQFVTVIVIGSAFSSRGIFGFLTSTTPYKFILASTIDISKAWYLDTVLFYRGSPLGEGFNGSLWSVKQELIYYLFVLALLLCRGLTWQVALVLLAVLTAIAALGTDVFPPNVYLWGVSAFFMGSFIYFLWKRGHTLPVWPLGPCLMVFAVALATHRTFELFPFFAAYPLLGLATSTRYALPSLRGFGDISYGMYLYGWPIEQAIRGTLGPGTPWWVIFSGAMASAGIAGYLSWHLLEKRALKLKRIGR